MGPLRANFNTLDLYQTAQFSFEKGRFKEQNLSTAQPTFNQAMKHLKKLGTKELETKGITNAEKMACLKKIINIETSLITTYASAPRQKLSLKERIVEMVRGIFGKTPANCALKFNMQLEREYLKKGFSTMGLVNNMMGDIKDKEYNQLDALITAYKKTGVFNKDAKTKEELESYYDCSKEDIRKLAELFQTNPQKAINNINYLKLKQPKRFSRLFLGVHMQLEKNKSNDLVELLPFLYTYDINLLKRLIFEVQKSS